MTFKAGDRVREIKTGDLGTVRYYEDHSHARLILVLWDKWEDCKIIPSAQPWFFNDGQPRPIDPDIQRCMGPSICFVTEIELANPETPR